MLPSRIFRSTIITPTFRGLCTPRQATASFRHRSRLGLGSHLSFFSDAQSRRSNEDGALKNTTIESLSLSANLSQSSATSCHSHRVQTDPLEPRLSLTFTCTAPNCSTRSSHTFTKRAYEKGVVLVECPGCKNR